MLDPIALAQLDRSRPLKAREPRTSATCAIRGCPIDVHTNAVVTLPDRKGTACASCADDSGFDVRWP